MSDYVRIMFIESGILINALLLGVMISFIVVTSPTVFKTLDEEHSKNFLRFIFPRLFNFCFLISTLMFLFFALAEFSFGMVVGIAISISFLINTYFLTPRINKMRDLMLTGHVESEKQFKKLHFASVILYLLSILFIVSIFAVYYYRLFSL